MAANEAALFHWDAIIIHYLRSRWEE